MERRISLITLEEQPNFPDHDLTDANADIIGEYYLPETPSVALEANRLAEHQRMLFQTVLELIALRGVETPIQNEPDSYHGFTTGFASYEFIQLLVTRAPYDTVKAASRLQALFTGPEAISFPERIETWPDRRPNIYNTIIKQGYANDATIQNIHSRALGAHVAFELQQPLLDVA